MNKKTLVWLLRILVFALFVLSAVAKMFPIWAFEKQLVDLGLMSWCMAPYFSRALIALELAIGILIIQPHFLKKIVIPVTIGLLVVFCAHLTLEMVKHGAMNGNCGCFGEWIPMTPLQSIIKNGVLIALILLISTDSFQFEPKFNQLIGFVLWYQNRKIINNHWLLSNNKLTVSFFGKENSQ